MPFINWGNHTADQRRAQNQLEWDAVHEQMVRMARMRMQAQQAPAGGNSIIAQTTNQYVENNYIDNDYLE
jgi:hypothetical protein